MMEDDQTGELGFAVVKQVCLPRLQLDLRLGGEACGSVVVNRDRNAWERALTAGSDQDVIRAALGSVISAGDIDAEALPDLLPPAKVTELLARDDLWRE